MPTRQGEIFSKNASTYRRLSCRRTTILPCASTRTWKTDFAMSKLIVATACILAPPNHGRLNRQPHPWHSRAGGGAVPQHQQQTCRWRVTREGHARFWERPGVKVPRATRQLRRALGATGAFLEGQHKNGTLSL